MNAEPRVPHLDGVRGLAVLLVLVSHLLGGMTPTGLPAIPDHPISMGGGFTGVQLFFVLSGFLITRSLASSIRSDRPGWLLRFYAKRFRRLYPALLFSCVVFVTAGAFLGQPADQLGAAALRSLSYTSNLNEVLLPQVLHWGWIDHTWSLSLEEQFYLLWPWLLMGLLRLDGRKPMVGALCLALLATVVRRYPPFNAAPYTLVRWDALMLGAMTALSPWRLPRAVAVTGTLAFLVLSAFPVVPGRNLNHTLFAVLACAVLHAAPHIHAFRHRVLCHLGVISYSLYLMHPLFIRLGLSPVLSVPCSLAAGHLMQKHIEARFNRPSAIPTEQRSPHPDIPPDAGRGASVS
jgi:peptidoglycan/LPS O-acetylase OafA/YrhL